MSRDAFLTILSINKDRVLGVMKSHYKSCGSAANETRGGNRKLAKFADKQAKIVEFGQSLKVIESHYNRHRATLRKYIAPELNIAKLCKMYNGSVGQELKVKEAYFREVLTKISILVLDLLKLMRVLLVCT